jgi:hypothetical protein
MSRQHAFFIEFSRCRGLLRLFRIVPFYNEIAVGSYDIKADKGGK